MSANYAQLAHALRPEFSLVLGALVVVAGDLTAGRGRSYAQRLHAALAFGAIALVAALVQSFLVGAVDGVFGQVLSIDTLAVATRVGILVLALLTLGIAAGAAPVRHPAEYVALILFATTGLLLMAAAQQLLVIFVSLELASLSLYLLAGFDKTRPDSAEAGLKYFLFGGMAAAFLLFGFSLLYGLTGSLDLPVIAVTLAQHHTSPLLLVALVMVLVAFGFKAAAAPFHLWAPDAYQGAPTPSAVLIATASKLAGFVLFTRLLWLGLRGAAGSAATLPYLAGWMPVLALLSLASLFVGNLVALAQTNLRRLLAYSAIAHAGAMLIGVIAAGTVGPAPLFYYVATYGLATAGAFGVIAVLDRAGGCQRISDLAGLYRRSPLLALTLFVFILSLAGVPPLAGFFGKFAVFAGALQVNGLSGPVGWLVVTAILFSAVALYYYLIVLKQALVVAPPENAPRIAIPPVTAVTLLLAALLLIALGIAPPLLLRVV